jgi:hypothetical protein
MTYLGDLLHDRLDTLQSLLANGSHLVGELRVLAALPLLISLVLGDVLLLDVAKESDLSDLVAIVVNDIAVVINLETSAVTKITSSKTADDVAILVADLTLLVDVHARHGVDLALLLLRLPALGLADDVTVLVVDIAILIDVVTNKLLDVTLNDAANDVAARALHGAILSNGVVVETSEGTLGARGGAVDNLSPTDDVSSVVPDLALTIDLLADKSSWVALRDTTKDVARRVDDVSSLVDSAPGKRRQVDHLLLFLFLLEWLGMALDIAVLIDDVTVFINRVTNEFLRITLGDLTNAVAVVVFDKSVLDDAQALEASKGSLLASDTLVVRNQLTASDHLAGIAVNETLTIRLASCKFLEVAFDELTDWDALAVDKVALLVQAETVKNREIGRFRLFLVLKGLSVALDIAELVEDITILIDTHADKTLGIALNDSADNVVISIGNLAFSDDAETLKTAECAFRLGLAFALRDHLATSDNLSGVVVDETLAVRLAASELLDVTLNQTSDGNALLVDELALLVQGETIKR